MSILHASRPARPSYQFAMGLDIDPARPFIARDYHGRYVAEIDLAEGWERLTDNPADACRFTGNAHYAALLNAGFGLEVAPALPPSPAAPVRSRRYIPTAADAAWASQIFGAQSDAHDKAQHGRDDAARLDAMIRTHELDRGRTAPAWGF